MIHISPIPAFQDNYIWVIHNQQYAASVDPGDAAPVLEYLAANKLQLIAILITHHHHDHVGGIADMVDQFSVPVYGPMHEKIPAITHPLQEGDTVHLKPLSIHFSVLDVPGHTAGHIAYYGKNTLFCGDTLFCSGCGRIFEGTPQQMYQSLLKLASLPDDTKVYCTHEYTLSNLSFSRTVEPNNLQLAQFENEAKKLRTQNIPTIPSTIKQEKAINPFLRCDQSEVIHHASIHAGNTLTEPLQVFTALRHWKNNF